MQDEKSNDDQKRACRDEASKNHQRLLPEFEFSDSAVSGTKRDRDGLNKLLAGAEHGDFKTVYFHSLSRIARESVISMPILKRLVYKFSVRVISVSEGIDSIQPTWDLIASLLSEIHGRQIKENAANVFRGQVGTLLQKYSVGDYCYGYKGEPIPGSEANRRGKNAKPNKRTVTDPERSVWVKRIFVWFVEERQAIAWIVRELNRLGAPKCHRATTPSWHRQLVVGILSQQKYIGVWEWGRRRNVRDAETGAISQVLRSDAEVEGWTLHRPELRQIDDRQFAKAQELLESNHLLFVAHRRKNGKLTGGGNRQPRHLLSQLLVCSECKSRFYVGGANGKYMICPGRKNGLCSQGMHLPKKLAEEMVLTTIGRRVLESESWVQAVLESALIAWDRCARTEPQQGDAMRTRRGVVNSKINSLVLAAEDGGKIPELENRLSELRRERTEIDRQLAKLESMTELPRNRPDENAVRDQLARLGATLRGAAPVAAHALRELVGQIEISEVKSADGKSRFQRGKFRIRAAAVAIMAQGDHQRPTDPDEGEVKDLYTQEIVIDFILAKPIDPSIARARELFDRDILDEQISKELGVSRSWAAKLVRLSFAAEGLKRPNRYERTTRLRQARGGFKYQQVSDQVFELDQKRKKLQEIAAELDLDRNLVTAALRHAYQQRGLPSVDGRTRRKSLTQKSRRKRKAVSDEESTESIPDDPAKGDREGPILRA